MSNYQYTWRVIVSPMPQNANWMQLKIPKFFEIDERKLGVLKVMCN